MDTSSITTLIAYNFWANERILMACEQLSTDEFTRAVTPDPGWGSLRGILVHILDTEYGWRSVLQSQAADILLEATDFADGAELRARWNTEQAAWLAYAAELSTERINNRYGDDPTQGPRVWQTILHVINHGTQHRSEAAAILTGYHCSPGEFDFDLFLQEHPEYLSS